MNQHLTDERLEALCTNAAHAVAAGFTTFVIAMWARTGEPVVSHLVAAALVWMVLVVAGTLPSRETS